MNPTLVRQLLLYLIEQLHEHDSVISKIRIVKLLYLVDLEHYRSYQTTLTGLDWIYYHYGPYAFEIDTVLSQARIDLGEERIETAAGHTAYVYRVHPGQSIDNLIRLPMKMKINRILQHWASRDTRELLDYVYTETEPMQEAVFGQPLDFSSVRRDIRVSRPSSRLKLDDDKTLMLRKMLTDQTRKAETTLTPPPRYDELYFESMRVLDEENMADLPIGSRISMTSDAVQSFRQTNE